MLIIISGCLEENISVTATEDFNNSALLLRELEERGDFINSPEFPALVSAESVYNAFNSYIIIDIRPKIEYDNGHIINSINVNSDELYEYATKIDAGTKSILLVSRTGQAAAYYLTLLRYAGIKNIYSLKFGIAVWNNYFAHLWTNNFNNFIDDRADSELANGQYDFNNIAQYFKPASNKLPNINLSKPNLSQKEITDERIKEVIALGFDEASYGNIITENTVGIEYVAWKDYKTSEEFFIVCYANSELYFRPQETRGCLLECSSHPWGTHLYNAFYPYNDFRSSAELQSLPNNKPIIIYSFTGERSAMAVAFLKLFGYNAKSVIFGGQYMFHSRFVTTNYNSSESLSKFGITEKSFKNYPYSN